MGDFQLGNRVLVQGYIATVRFVGEIEGQKGTWVGVEWDDASRGKHDGCTGGRRYFSCESKSPTAGSFVRIERVQPGLNISEALQARYTNQMAEYGVETTGEELYVHTVRQRRVKVELVGADKISKQQSHLGQLTTARLVGMGIDKVGDAAALASSVPNLEVLDLSCNLFSSLPEVWRLLRDLSHALPELQVVIFSDNKIAAATASTAAAAATCSGDGDNGEMKVDPSNSDAAAGGVQSGGGGVKSGGNGVSIPSGGADVDVAALSFSSVWPFTPRAPCAPLVGLKALVLNRTGVVWTEMLALAPGLPGLAELHLDGNAMESLSHPRDDGGVAAERTATHKSALFPALEVLSVENNRLTSWIETVTEIHQRAPGLRRLHLGGNPIDRIQAEKTNRRPDREEEGPVDGLPTEVSDSAESTGSTGSTGSGLLGNLECLFLGNCQIQEWADVDALSALPSLRELRISGNPVLAKAPSGGRFQVIARVPQLTCLNAAEVRPRERRDSELRYLQVIGAEMETALRAHKRQQAVSVAGRSLQDGAPAPSVSSSNRDASSSSTAPSSSSPQGESSGPSAAEEDAEANQRQAVLDAVLARHPRATALQALHGPIVLSQSGAGAGAGADSGSSLSSSLVELKLTCVSTSASAKMGTQVKRLPRGMTVAALKALCEKFFKVRASNQVIFLKDPNAPIPDQVPDSEEQSSLAYLGVQDNFEVLVDEAE